MNIENARKALKKYFGYERFRPMQEQIIQAVYDKNDALVLMPTGGGKSMCYQIPALTLPGTCIVVSPLISLMRDQVNGLRSNGVEAAFLNSSLSRREQVEIEEQLFKGHLDLLYVSPEKITSQGFLPLLKKRKINLFAIDEAHCISAWGHDFRQEYTKLKFIKEEFPDTPIIALTATADKATRGDIVAQLNLSEPEIFVASFDRPNLHLEVKPGQQRMEQILYFLRRHPDEPGIIYCLSRKSTERVAEKLQKARFNATAYHAGLTEQERSQAQEDFINDKVQIVCATVAFGMGIDKSNVRWVIHYNMPKNLENYYQEIGRAGRDGIAASTLLFYSFADVSTYREILQQNAENSTHLELQLAKLERMMQFSEASFCRRQILLNYFGEDFRGNCGNCDICKNPPEYFDGTILAQKALSAVYRLRQSVSINILIDVLRGSQKKSIYERGYQNIKTFGAGREHSNFQWQHFITQLINTGYLEISYQQNMALKLTPASEKVLFDNQKVQLVKFVPQKEKQKKFQPIELSPEEQLFEKLRQTRKSLSQERGVPPYLIFSDATLKEMARQEPITDQEMINISGVSQRKLHLFGDAFAQEILKFKKSKFRKNGLSSADLSLEMIQQGLSLEQIANKRGISTNTVYNHIAELYAQDKAVPILDYVTQKEIKAVERAIAKVGSDSAMKPIFEELEGKIIYNKIKLAIAFLRKKQ